MIAMLGQIVLESVRQQPLAIPGVPLLDWMAVEAHQAIVLDVIDQFMGDPTEQGREQKGDHALKAGERIG
jgi:hypothetical protein